MVDLSARVEARFRQLGKSYFRASPEDAAVLGSTIAGSHGPLAAYCQFCLAPGALPAAVGIGIVERWAATMPQMLRFAVIVNQDERGSAAVVSLKESLLDELWTITSGAARELRGLPAAQADELGHCARRSASASYAFFQRCLSPGEYPLKELGPSLKAYMNGAVPFGVAAGALLGVAGGRTA